MCQNSAMKRGIETIYRIYYSKCATIVQWCTSVLGEESAMQVESTRKRHVERFFWEVVDIDRSHAWECKTFPGTRGFHWFEVLITQYLKFGPENWLVFSCLVVMETRMGVNHWIRLMDGIAYHFHLIHRKLLS